MSRIDAVFVLAVFATACSGEVAVPSGADDGSAVCGNGIVETGESCDDSNTAAGDGCSRDCQVEAGFVCDEVSGCEPVGGGRTCSDGERNGDEAGVDCGGSCLACEDASCTQGADCASGNCVDSTCAEATCADGIQNGDEVGIDCGGPCTDCVAVSCSNGILDGDETDVDCGGSCLSCDGGSCSTSAECQSGVCDGTACSAPSCTDGVRNGDESGIDCGGACLLACDGQSCAAGADCASGVCDASTCAVATCSDAVQNGDETGSDCGGECPDSCDGETCNSGADCQSGVCNGALCETPSCSDGVQNGAETGVDCGGLCLACDSDTCSSADECTSGVCNLTCQPATCSDSVHNGDETGTDCGGACPDSCDGETCNSGADCQSGVCNGALCETPSCSDGVQNGAETGVDCGGLCLACDSDTCSSADECTSGVCNLTCQPATCSDSVHNGDETDVDCGGSCLACDGETCSDNSECSGGFCDVDTCAPGCSSRPDPNAFCAPQLCVSNQCVTACSITAPGGYCPGSKACVGGSCANPCDGDLDCDSIADDDENSATCAAESDEAGCGSVGCVWVAEGCWLDTDGNGNPDHRDRDADGDGIPDSVEAGDDASGAPVDTDNDGTPDYQDLDSDNDHISDDFEAGFVATSPRDTDGDGVPDFRDTDSDNDGINDACEVNDGVAGLCSATGIVDIDGSLFDILDSDSDGRPDFRDLDSDGDGISDEIESRSVPADATTATATGVDSDGDGVPDYRELDSDGDGVPDGEEDVNGDGIVNCQVDGDGVEVPDFRGNPACGDPVSYPAGEITAWVYDYNPGCPEQKCVLAETSRVHPDTDADGTGDAQDGIFLVCSTENLKPINVFYSQEADYALALEPRFTATEVLTRGGQEAGLTFDDPGSGDGSEAVSGFLLNRNVSDLSLATSDPAPARNLIEKALAQAGVDEQRYERAPSVAAVELVINRNFTSFDGYGAVISRYNVTTSSDITTAELRDELGRALQDSGVDGDSRNDPISGFADLAGGPTASTFTLMTETLYRFDDGVDGTVIVAAALVPTGANADAQQTYNYRTRCSDETVGTCSTRVGCELDGTSCIERSNYQLPLFFADNIANGSALAQFGDDLAALCQSLVQNFAPLDFLWVVDDSGSMTEEIRQVQTSAELFFGILNNTEADYRVSQTTTFEDESEWPPQDGLNDASSDETIRRNGMLQGGFTGAVAGIVDPSFSDRLVSYTCSDGCENGESDCCAACDGSVAAVDDPACYFASRLPTAAGRGEEFGLMMGQWATFRGNADPYCYGAGQTLCDALDGCAWDGAAATCVENYCAGATKAYSCDENADLIMPYCNQFTTQTGCEGDSNCTWFTANNVPGECFSSTCAAYGSYPAGNEDQTGCNNDPLCEVHDPSGGNNRHCHDEADTDGACELWASAGQAACETQNCVYTDGMTPTCTVATATPLEVRPAGCEWSQAQLACVPSISNLCAGYAAEVDCDAQGPRCFWTGGACEPTGTMGNVLCNGTDETTCEDRGGSLSDGNPYCEWDDVAATCSPRNTYYFRSDAARIVVVLSDEEECYVKDADENGKCTNQFADYAAFRPYDDAIRMGREGSYQDYYLGRGYTVFGIVGDKADPSQTPASGNGGCDNGSTGEAEAGNTYIELAEVTGGGWGSICAVDLFPTIESIVISSIAKASPYRLEGFIDGTSVQPISSTIKVAVETCSVASEYPLCASGTEVRVVPRSRDNGYDYDPLTNALILYGDARPVLEGDITVSYRYWIDNVQDPEGNPECPCPGTTFPACDCPEGEACGVEDGTNNCEPQDEELDCNAIPGCAWNEASAECLVTGVCEPDPECGGGCPDGEVCNPDTGLCACDATCNPGCLTGQSCDSDLSSPTCGQCLCDTDCGFACGIGTVCDSDAGSTTCGQCLCDTTCGGGCVGSEVCDSDPASPTCGSCQAPTCLPSSTDPSCCPDEDGDGFNVCAGDCVDSWATFCAVYGAAIYPTACPPAPGDEIPGYTPADINPGATEDFVTGCDDGVDQNCDGTDEPCGDTCNGGCECSVGQGCAGGACGACTSDADCCVPLKCFGGSCIAF